MSMRLKRGLRTFCCLVIWSKKACSFKDYLLRLDGTGLGWVQALWDREMR
jgi:hypothetical protein